MEPIKKSIKLSILRIFRLEAEGLNIRELVLVMALVMVFILTMVILLKVAVAPVAGIGTIAKWLKAFIMVVTAHSP